MQDVVPRPPASSGEERFMFGGGVLLAISMFLSSSPSTELGGTAAPSSLAAMDSALAPSDAGQANILYPMFADVVKAGAEIIEVKVVGGDEPALLVSLRLSI